MDRNSNAYVVFFAVAVCVVMAACLAATFNALKPRIDKNNLFDKQRNVLIACGLYDPEAGWKSQPELEKIFEEKVDGKVLQFFEEGVLREFRERGKNLERKVLEVVRVLDTNIQIKDLPKVLFEERKKPKAERRILGEFYVAETTEGKSYCIPISGYGLWSTLYGFLALKQDLNTVQGITFYKHGETPGLGGEVEKAWWTGPWQGKKILDESGELVGITILKGRGNELDDHQVDGISGSTITGNGVNKFVASDLKRYEPYFKGIRP